LRRTANGAGDLTLPFRKVARFMPKYGPMISSQQKNGGRKNHDKAKNFF
jgi:hypothetical protein